MSVDVERQPALIAAGVWLLQTLERRPMPAPELFQRAREDGHALKTLWRAARELGVRSRKRGLYDGRSWELPASLEGGH